MITLLTLTACGPDSAPPSSSPAPVELAAVRGEGGQCAEGLCRQEVTIYSTGEWRRSAQDKVVANGRLSTEQLTVLQSAIDRTDFAALLSAPPPATCPSATDGLEMTYRAGFRSVSSCQHELPGKVPLIIQLDTFFSQLK
ncbi:hypothetical protein [Actinoplanes sp. N902-109]|uniref:hypothetical protein n=1 Tax=Actinoplanes sp. (strain N902-109) TaxID=649831 RepID=UPI0012F7E078|nr:hypothetical protein [Actinoplanes sp. N902-109]